MRASAASLGALLTVAAACGPALPVRRTRVDREERVVADSDARTRWFAGLWAMQRVLAQADLRRLDALGPLRSMLCLPADAGLPQVAAAARVRFGRDAIQQGRVRLRRTSEADDALGAWAESITATNGVAVSEHPLAVIEGALRLEQVRGDDADEVLPRVVSAAEVAAVQCVAHRTAGEQGAAGPLVAAQVAAVLRRSAAQGMIFERMRALSEGLQGQREAMIQGAPPALVPELRAAEGALRGVAARAVMQMHESARLEHWAQGLLMPDGEVAPPEVDDLGTQVDDSTTP